MATALEPRFAVSFPATLPALSISDSDLRGTAQVMGAILDYRTRAMPALERIVSDQGTNTVGKRNAWTTFAEAELPKLHTARATLEANHAEITGKLAQVEEAARVQATGDPVKRMDQWQSLAWFNGLPATKQQEVKDKLMKGELKDLRDDWLALPSFAFPGTQHLRTMLMTAYVEEHADTARWERLREQEKVVTAVGRILSEHIAATEAGADLDRLRAKGLDIPKGRGEMTDKEKSDFIDQKGLASFQKLPA